MADATLIWRACCLLALLQTLHWLLLQGRAAQRQLGFAAPMAVAARADGGAGFATLSQAFFSRRGSLGAPPPPPLRLQFAQA